MDGHHRAKFAESQGKRIKAIVIPKNDYDTLTAKGIHQGEIQKEWVATGMFEKARAKNVNPVELSNKEMINQDADHLTKLNSKMDEANQPSRQAKNYETPKKEPAATGTIHQRERSALEKLGIEKDYDADIEAYKALENPRIIQSDEFVDANDFMKGIDDEISGMDDILRCAIG